MQETWRCWFDPWVRKIPGEGNDNSLQYSCLGNPMHRGALQATIHGVARSRTQQTDLTTAIYIFRVLLALWLGYLRHISSDVLLSFHGLLFFMGYFCSREVFISHFRELNFVPFVSLLTVRFQEKISPTYHLLKYFRTRRYMYSVLIVLKDGLIILKKNYKHENIESSHSSSP